MGDFSYVVLGTRIFSSILSTLEFTNFEILR